MMRPCSVDHSNVTQQKKKENKRKQLGKWGFQFEQAYKTIYTHNKKK